MDSSDRLRVLRSYADAALALTGLEVTLGTLRDNGVVTNEQLAEILYRLRAMINSASTDPGAANEIAEVMQRRLREMAAYLAVDMREN